MENTTTPPAHTPGPWQIEWQTDDDGWVSYQLKDVSEDDEEIAPKARLIAAAPTLLQAMKDAVETALRQDERSDGEALDDAVAILKKALAQAEGR